MELYAVLSKQPGSETEHLEQVFEEFDDAKEFAATNPTFRILSCDAQPVTPPDTGDFSQNLAGRLSFAMNTCLSSRITGAFSKPLTESHNNISVATVYVNHEPTPE